MRLKSYFKKNYKGLFYEAIGWFFILFISNFIGLADSDSDQSYYGVDVDRLLLFSLIGCIPSAFIFHHFNLWMIKKGWIVKRKSNNDKAESKG